jgi:hypothetical protein
VLRYIVFSLIHFPAGDLRAAGTVVAMYRHFVLCRRLVDAGVVEPLVSQLRHSTEEGKEAAAVALARLAATVDARKRIAVAGAVPVLVASLPTLGPKGMEGAVLCLEKLVTLQEAAEQTMQEPVCH